MVDNKQPNYLISQLLKLFKTSCNSNTSNFMMTLLQIQATISTLIVAFVAIIGGNINDIYMGMSVTDYLLNIKHCKLFRQKNLFIESIMLFVLNIFIYLIKAPIIFFVVTFALSIIVVIISGSSIFSVLEEKKEIHMEIKDYIEKDILDKNTNGEQIELKREQFVQSFANDWLNKMTLQDNVTFEEYLEVYLKAIGIMYQYESRLSIDTINNVTTNLCTKMLESPNNIIKLRGVRLLTDFYYKIFVDNNVHNKERCYRLTVFNSVFYEFEQALLELHLKDIRKLFPGEFIMDEVLIIDQNVSLNCERDVLKYNLEAVQESYEHIGCLLYQKQKRDESELELFKLILSDKCVSRIKDLNTLDENKVKQFGISVAQNYFHYIVGLIRYGFDILVIEELFNNEDLIKKIYNKYHAILMLAVFEYLYLVKYQSKEYKIKILKEEYQNVDSIISFCKDNSKFACFISLLSECQFKYINKSLVEGLEALLSGLTYSIDKYTLFSGKNGVKEFIALMLLSRYAYYPNSNYYIDVLEVIITGCPDFSLTRCKIENYFRMFMLNIKDLSEKVENAYRKYQEIMTNSKQIKENVNNENNSMY